MDTEPTPRPRTGWLNIAVDYGPLLVFLAVYKFAQPSSDTALGQVGAVIQGTVAFMVAAVLAFGFSKWKFGRVSPMLMLSTALIVGFGALTLWLRDPAFIQFKPTAIYLLFGVLLLAGWLRGKALLQILLEAAFDGVDQAGWLKLSRNWGVFFLAMAALNEALRYLYNVENDRFETWLWAKLWLFMPLSFLFTFTQIPMLIRHGLSLDDKAKAVTEKPPTG